LSGFDAANSNVGRFVVIRPKPLCAGPAMIPVPAGVKVWLATGHTDMRKGFPGLSLMVQETLKRDPMCGHLFVFRNVPVATAEISL